MHKSKLIDILKTFTKKELKKFSLYVTSPFFNSKEEVIKLYELVKTHYPDFDHPSLNKSNVFEILYPNDVFKEQKLRYIMTDLTKLLESFLIHQHLQDKKKYHPILLAIYEERKLNKHFSALFDMYQKLLERENKMDSEYYLTLHQLEEKLFLFNSLKQTYEPAKEIPKILSYLDYFYVSQKLKYSCEIYNTQNHLDTQYKHPILLNTLIELIEKEKNEQPIVVKIYYYILMTLIRPENNEYFNHFLDYLEKHQLNFSQAEVTNMYIFARNYYIKKYVNGESHALKPMYEMYKKNIKDGFLFVSDYLVHWDYRNIVHLGLYFTEHDFVENFIHEYQQYLQEEYRSDAYEYCLSCFYFAKKEYGKPIERLNGIALNFFYYYLDSKKLLAQCYYELNEHESLYYLIDATIAYIRRNNSISDDYEIMYKSFFNIVKKLVKIKEALPLGRDKQLKRSIKNLEREIQQVKRVNDWAWLSAKIEELGIRD